MSRVLVAAWGPDSSKYAGHRLTLYRDPNVKFGGILVGGIRISHMTGINKQLRVPLTVTRGHKAMFTVEPLPDEPVGPSAVDVAMCDSVDELRAMWHNASDDVKTLIQERVTELQAGDSQ